MIRCHCSKGYDHTIASFIKPVSEFLVSPTNKFYNKQFHQIKSDKWKLARISPIPKIHLPVEPKTTDQYPFY